MLAPTLPVVSEDIKHSLVHELKTHDPHNDGSYFYEILQRLNENNPEISNFLNFYCQGMKSERRSDCYAVALLIYRMLESQDEANQMVKML